ncbi:acetolactate synthase-1/2/3 large subunit [Sporomusaceae bacterium BoRhaA]|uniref:thiamine pyrophosphate-binding protein n=1 Tax=Pelorhabdus rhamnosifermentans TaxID=2772457 RepID=UPI001FE83B02|nr:thiamine pyrophosphate-binding protein [Pelorhabdus rhamnosifermentans]MBU2703219.1 acetolactate synthase-1/2/3 large subunit [Pelorhabdus rhamnosifermentans]
MIKLSDYVINFLEHKGVKTVFMLPGGGCMHLVDSLGKNERIEYICCLHEQAAAIAAEAYSQHTNHIGVGLVTTGPGGTNTITGVTAAWIDSTPCLFISGQVKRSDLINDTGVRQMGNQEVDIVSIVKPITKYAKMVLKPEKIRYHLEKAYYYAMQGRRGPVWIDIPLDVQAAMIDETSLVGFTPDFEERNKDLSESVEKFIELINQAKRPVVIVGNGVKLAHAEPLCLDFIERANIPMLLTWKTIDLVDENYPLQFGCPGTLGHRGANFILQNADLLIVLGSRLDSSLTAFNHTNFAPKAKKVMVDIDRTEIDKMQFPVELSIVADIKEFLQDLCQQKKQIICKDQVEWLNYCKRMKTSYPVVLPKYYEDKEYVNSYVFIDKLCNFLTSQDVIVPESSGSAGEITYQAFKIKKGQKMKNAAGLGAMGFGLPYAIGACLANDKKRTILINGDGAFQLNIQELATLAGHKLPIKIFIWDNGGYASIMGTQRKFFEGHYVASNQESKLYLPDLKKVAEAYGLKTFCIANHGEMEEKIQAVLKQDGPVLCQVKVSPMQMTAPKVQAMKLPDGNMVSKPLEDMWPYLDEAEIQWNMITGEEKSL